MLVEIVVFIGFVAVAFFLFRFKKEIAYLKNLYTAISIAGFLIGGAFAYKKFVIENQEFIENQEKKEQLPPTFIVDCKLEKVGESDSCYWLKASMNYESKVERRIFIYLSSFDIVGINVKSTNNLLDTVLIIDRDGYYAKDFEYESEPVVLYSRKIDTDSWYDGNQKATKSFIIKIPSRYDVASLISRVYVANHDNRFISDYTFRAIINKSGQFDVAVYSMKNGQRIVDTTTTTGYYLRDQYGYCQTHSISEVYLKESLKK